MTVSNVLRIAFDMLNLIFYYVLFTLNTVDKSLHIDFGECQQQLNALKNKVEGEFMLFMAVYCLL
jgi:hypothetical protein